MPKRDSESKPATRPRGQAKKDISEETKGRESADSRSVDAIIHELQVHQVELEMQNQALRDAQATIAQSQAKYADFYDFSPVGYLTLDENGLIRDLNLTAAELLGDDRECLKGKLFRLFVSSEYQLAFDRHRREVLGSAWKKSCDLLLSKKDKTLFYGHLESIGDGDVGQGLIRSVLTDVTERKQLEETQRKSEERFRQIAECVADFIWEVDKDGLYRYASPSVEPILGFSPDELVGKKHFYDLFSQDAREDLREEAIKVFSRKEPFRKFRNPNVSKQGTVVYLETSGVPMLDEAGNLLGYRGADKDITERIHDEERMKERLEFEVLLANLSSRFVNLSPERVDPEIDEVLRILCEHLDLDVSTVWQLIDPESMAFAVTHVYTRVESPPLPERTNGDVFPWCTRECQAGRIIAVSTDEAPPEAAREQELWR